MCAKRKTNIQASVVTASRNFVIAVLLISQITVKVKFPLESVEEILRDATDYKQTICGYRIACK